MATAVYSRLNMCATFHCLMYYYNIITCNYCLWPFHQHARLLWQLYSGGLYVCAEMQIQPKGDILSEAIFAGS